MWGLFAAPRSVKHVPAAKAAVKVAVFGLATVGLFANGHTALAATFASLIVINTVALHVTGRPTSASIAKAPMAITRAGG